MDNFFVELCTAFWQLVAAVLRAFAPLLIGLALAYLFNAPAEWIRRKLFAGQETLSDARPRGRIVSIVIAYALAALVLFLVVYAFLILILGALPADGFYATVQAVYAYFENAARDVSAFIEKYLPAKLGAGELDPAAMLSSWIEKHFSLEKVAAAVSAAVGGAVNFFIGLVASIYLLRDKEFFLLLWQKFLALILKQNVHGQVNETLSEINRVLTTFIKGALVDSLIVALLSSIVLSALGVRFAVVIGLIGGLLNIIPYFGPFFSMVPAFLVAFFSRGLLSALTAVLALFLIQQLDSNFIYPRIVGQSVGLHPLFVLLSLAVLGHFGGIVGMLLAVPAAGIVQILIKKWAYRY